MRIWADRIVKFHVSFLSPLEYPLTDAKQRLVYGQTAADMLRHPQGAVAEVC
jgi:hypothetical protein